MRVIRICCNLKLHIKSFTYETSHLTFSPNSLFHKLELKLKRQLSQRSQAHLFSQACMLLMQGGLLGEKWESVTHFICFILTNGRHDVYLVAMVALQWSYILWCVFHHLSIYKATLFFWFVFSLFRYQTYSSSAGKVPFFLPSSQVCCCCKVVHGKQHLDLCGLFSGLKWCYLLV